MKKLVLLLIFLLTPAVQAAEYTEITLPAAIEYAQSYSQRLKIKEMDVEVAKNKIEQANQLKNPTIGSFINMGKAGENDPQYLGVTQTIELAKRHSRKKFAESEYKLSKENFNQTKFELGMDVRDAYVELVGAKTILKQIDEQYELLSEICDLAKEKYKAGLANQMDVFQTELAINQLKIQKNSAQVNVNNAINELNSIIYCTEQDFDSVTGVYSDNYAALLVPQPSTELPSLDEILKKYLDSCYYVKIAKQEIDVAEKNLTNTIRHRVPDLEVTAGWSYNECYRNPTGNFYGGAYVGVNLVNIPILYTFSPEIKNAKIALEQANLKYNSVVDELVKDISAAYADFNTAKTNLNYYNSKLIGDSFILMSYAKENYKKDKSDLISLIVMEKSYKDIIIGYTQALVDYCKCWTALLRVLDVESLALTEAL